MSGPRASDQLRPVAVVGGGLAGMAAALALAQRGHKVELFEQNERLGGRVGSFRDARTGELVDRCMHVGMGCCTRLLDFIRRMGVEDRFARHRRLNFIGPAGEVCRFKPWPWLPAPLHLVPGLARLRYLGLRDRLSIARCMLRLGRLAPGQPAGEGTVAGWLRAQGQSEAAIDRFWSVLLVSALGETVARAGLAMARKVVLDGFLRSPRGCELFLPKVPLAEIFDRPMNDRLRQLGVEVHLGTRARAIEISGGRCRAIVLRGGKRRQVGGLVVAVPWRQITRLFSPEQRPLLGDDWKADRLEPAAITAVHLWFDRAITRLPHAVLVGRTSQWMFRPSAEQSPVPPGGHYVQIVISASNRLVDLPRGRLVEQVCNELASIWPAARQARLLHHRVVTEREAVFSVTPESDSFRPKPQIAVPNIVLAGDWTDTGWPATMEGAIRSGRQAGLSID